MEGDADGPEEPGGGSPAGRSRSRLLLAAGVVVAAVLFVVLVLDWRRVVAVVASADLRLLAGGLLAGLVGLAGWSEAIRRLLPADAAPVSRRRGFLVYAAGSLVRNAVPVGYAGSIAVLAILYRRQASIPLHRSLAAVSVAELLSAVASAGVAVVGLALLVAAGPVSPLVRWLAVVALALAVGATLTGALAWYRREAVERLVHGIGGVVASGADRLAPGAVAGRLSPAAVEASIAGYFGALSTVSARRQELVIAAGYATLGWLGLVVALYASGLAVGYRVPLGLALFVVPVGGYATVLPVPGGLGGYELGVAGAIHLLGGVDPATALAVTLLFRLTTYWATIALGAAASAYLSVGIRRLAAGAVDPESVEPGGGQGPVDR